MNQPFEIAAKNLPEMDAYLHLREEVGKVFAEMSKFDWDESNWGGF